MSITDLLIPILIAGVVISVLSLGFAGAYLARFFRTKEKRQLRIALMLGLAVPVLAALAAYGGCVWVMNQVDKESILEPNFGQNKYIEPISETAQGANVDSYTPEQARLRDFFQSGTTVPVRDEPGKESSSTVKR